MAEFEELLKRARALTYRLGENVSGIDALVRLSGGASQETWRVDARLNTGEQQSLILRRAPFGKGAVEGGQSIGLTNEAALLIALSNSGLPIPEIIYACTPDDGLGPAYFMSCLKGETIARRILRDEPYVNVHYTLTQQCGAALAALHASRSPDNIGLSTSFAHDQLLQYEGILRQLGTERPVFELALQWLRERCPEPVSPVIVHGDFRLGNLMVDQAGLKGILDWELAHLGDPREDLGWVCVNSWRFGQTHNEVGGFGKLDHLLEAYAEAGGQSYTNQDILFWIAHGSFKWGVMCLMMYEAFRTGTDPSIDRGSIGRRTSETEIDLLNIIEAS